METQKSPPITKGNWDLVGKLMAKLIRQAQGYKVEFTKEEEDVMADYLSARAEVDSHLSRLAKPKQYLP